MDVEALADDNAGGTAEQPVDASAIDWTDPRAAAFRDAMNDDFNTPGALAVLFEMATDLNRTNPYRLADLYPDPNGYSTAYPYSES